MPPPKQNSSASSPRNRRLQWLVTGTYALLLLLGSVLPGSKLPSIPDWTTLFSPDKVAHFGAYGLFALLLSVFFSERRTRWAILLAVFVAALFGAAMEILQGISGTGRSFDPVDMVANLLGAIVGGLTFLLYQLLKTRLSTTVEPNE
ncbi:VanZ family protein [Neolewinella persica]|uniref:VanZ family protein n=1 Tax=Neolewinella persica TaxID=70998 RepID=UPI000A0299EE|nr:VanZ family protein [Neolewinella persica]